jgi:hypothetical protein
MIYAAAGPDMDVCLGPDGTSRMKAKRGVG